MNYLKGVRQGCSLSPMVFNLYLNEIPFCLIGMKRTQLFCLLTRLTFLFYMLMNLILILKSADEHQNAISILEKFCNDWLLSINSKKKENKSYGFPTKINKMVENQHILLSHESINQSIFISLYKLCQLQSYIFTTEWEE